MNAETRRALLLFAGGVAGYLIVMRTNPARASLRDGFWCLGRYKQLWLVPVTFGIAHALFSLWVRVYEAWAIPDAPPALLPWAGWQPPALGDALLAAALPAAESTASIFNCVVLAFPLSALGAAVFLSNWRGYQATVYRGLHRRCGRGWSVAIHAAFLTCALAALCKPVLFGGLPRLNAYLGETALLRAGEIVNTLSFFFEYLLGVGVQIYLVLLAFAWIRGLRFDFHEMRRFAARRFVFVVKWAVVVLALSALGINLPLVVASFQGADGQWQPTGWINATRWVLAVTLLVFCAAQALLIFHNESFRRAAGDALRFWRRYGWHVAWMLVVVALHFLVLAVANAVLPPALGQWTWPAASWSLLVYPLLWSGLAGWFLASWVCLFRRCERNAPDDGELMRF